MSNQQGINHETGTNAAIKTAEMLKLFQRRCQAAEINIMEIMLDKQVFVGPEH